MIGLMYLVLMAMLALNVSKDILDSFVQVNRSLESSVHNIGLKNDQMFADFQISTQYDPVRLQASFDKAVTVREQSIELVEYIENLKKQLVAKTEGIADEVADTMQLKNVNAKDNYDVPTQLMIGLSEDGSDGLSSELRMKIELFRKELLESIPADKREEANIGLILEGSEHDGRKLNWEMSTFYHTTLAASIVHLTKLQNDVKNAEYDVISKLYADVGKVDIPFDTVAPKVVAPTSYVLLGEEYNADVFLAAFSKTKDPKITINDTEIPVNNGLGNYRFKTNKEGMFTYNGKIEVETNNGEIKEFPFESNYIVARPSLTVSPTKMNVLYIGLDNPVSVSVPGVANENISVSISGSGNRIKRTGNGMYQANLVKNSPGEVNVNVTATMADGSKKSMGSVPFRVKRLPKPRMKVVGKTEDGMVAKGRIGQAQRVVSFYPNFEFDVEPETVEYTMEIFKDGGFKEYKMRGSRIPENLQRVLRGLRSGQRVTFTGSAKGKDGITHKMPSITLRIR